MKNFFGVGKFFSDGKFFQPLDRRTYVIVVLITLIALPAVVFSFKKSFFPLIGSLAESLVAAAFAFNHTGIPQRIIEFFIFVK